MKKLLSVFMALVLVVALSANVFAAGTASTEFEATCGDDNWWSRLVNPSVSWEPPSEGWLDTEVVTFDNWHYNITKLVEKAACTDLSNIAYVKATLEMVGQDSITHYNTGSSSPKVDLEYGEVYNADAPARFGDNAPYQEADLKVISGCTIDGNKAVVEGEIPEGSKVVALNIGGFGAITEAQKFVLTVEVTVKGEELPASAAAEETPAADEAPAADAAPADTAPAPNTGIALAVIPAVMALAVVAVSKKH